MFSARGAAGERQVGVRPFRAGLGPQSAPSAPYSERGLRVLVVDDEPLMRAAARRTLRSAGYDVIEAGSVTEALAILRVDADSVDFVLSDVGLPDRLGSELVREVESAMPALGTMLMSADTRDYLVQSGRVSADAEVLRKPFRGDDLLRAVEQTLSERPPQNVDRRRAAGI
jgi:two-component system cell cycle sensor histidine kinase/response regulator CckA